MPDVIAEATDGSSAREPELSHTEGRVGDQDAPQDLITPREVAALFCVNPKTVTRWAVAGRLTAYRTLGGHRRFSRAQIEQLLYLQARAS